MSKLRSDLLTTREQGILKLLLQAEGYTPIEQLTAAFCVSEKTISRDIRAIEKKFEDQGVFLYKRGKGYKVKDLSGMEAKCRDPLPMHRQKSLGMNIETRRNKIMALLLLYAPSETSINKLAESYYISNASIVNDLAAIDAKLTAKGLSLIRSHNGTHIEGDEVTIRRVLMEHIQSTTLDMDELMLNYDEAVADDHNLYAFFSHKDIYFVKRLLDTAETKLGGAIKDPYYINIFTHILVLLKRVGTAGTLPHPQAVEDYEYENRDIAHCVAMMIKQIGEYLGKNVASDEVFYLYQYIYSARFDGDEDSFELLPNHRGKESIEFARSLIVEVSSRIDCDLTGDLALETSLAMHVDSLAKRVAGQIFITNPLKRELEESFPDLFRVITAALNRQDKKPELQHLGPDELSYIVVYFQAALEKMKQKIRIGIVCSSGVGTSHLLAARVKRAFPDWEIVGIVSVKHVGDFKPGEVDVILTTVRLDHVEIPSVLVSALFNEADIIRVKQVI